MSDPICQETRDPARLAALHTRCFDVGWDAAQMTSLLGVPGTLALVATAPAGEDKGFIIARRVLEESEILTIGVLPAYRGQGISRMLLKNLVETLHAQGVEKLFLEVGEDNLPARQLYASQGFAPIGRRKDYYARRDGTREDAVTMALILR